MDGTACFGQKRLTDRFQGTDYGYDDIMNEEPSPVIDIMLLTGYIPVVSTLHWGISSETNF